MVVVIVTKQNNEWTTPVTLVSLEMLFIVEKVSTVELLGNLQSFCYLTTPPFLRQISMGMLTC